MENQTPNENLIQCPACGAEMVAGDACPECGFEGALVEAEQLEPLEIGTALVDRYEITETLETQGGALNCYLAFDKESGANVLIKGAAIQVGRAASLPQERQAGSLFYNGLKLECEILEGLNYPTIVKARDTFDVEGRAYLVEEDFEGGPLREAWHREDTSQSRQIDWLIQLCQTLAKVHGAGVLYNAVSPDRLWVSKENRLVLTDFSSACRLPLSPEHKQGVDFYVPPELALNPETADVRADLYALGVTWYELLLGRALTDDDFESQFLLKPLECESSAFVERPLHPSTHRILLKLTNRNPDLRFATSDELTMGKQPIASLQRCLLELKGQLTEKALVVGSQTNIGLQREANEDNLWAQNLSCTTADGHHPLGLFIVADGMGGAEAGEIASQIVIRAISAELTPKLITLHGNLNADHAETLTPAIREAIVGANAQVYMQAEKNPHWRGMGSTVVVAAVVGNHVYVGHVGDSRLYLINTGGISQKTEDHSIVHRLVKMGVIQPEEAETHPQRDVLTKAVGTQRNVEPDTLSFSLTPGDTLLLCSDGLTKHLTDAEIHAIIQNDVFPQRACDHLINQANFAGGEDNITVVVVRYQSIMKHYRKISSPTF